MNQPPRRPSRPARTPTSRPRKVAGHGRPDEPVADAVPDDVPADEPQAAETDAPTVRLDKAPTVAATPPPMARTEPDDGPTGRAPLVVLVAVIVVLLGLGAAEVVYLTSDDDGASGPAEVTDLTVRSVVDQAVLAADRIISASAADYDAEVEAATATMTDPFAEQFRETKAQVKEQFLAQETEVVVDVSYQGVVSATDDEIVALLFLTQTTQQGARGGVTPVQYRVTVTMVDTPDGWLVSDLQAL